MPAGSEVGRQSSDPSYGIYAYTAREWDPETNLYYYRARYYDPKIGRFTGEDPIGWFAGVNFYAYALGNPIRRTDPYGLDWRDAARETQRGWPFDPWGPRSEGFDKWPNPPHGPTRDRQRHCYYACIQMRRNSPMFAWWIPFDFVRQVVGAILRQRSWSEAAGDMAADWWGGMWAFDFTKTCEEQCNVCPTNK
jgi:RHS repeat-associated protein